MLVVTRKNGEKVVIGNEIEIQVLHVGRNHIRIGIKAPAHISIYREEIYQGRQNENATAVTPQFPEKQTPEKFSKAVAAG